MSAGEVRRRTARFSFYGGPLDGRAFYARAEPELVPLYRDARGAALGALTALVWEAPVSHPPLAGCRHVPHYVLNVDDYTRYEWAPLAYPAGEPETEAGR